MRYLAQRGLTPLAQCALKYIRAALSAIASRSLYRTSAMTSASRRPDHPTVQAPRCPRFRAAHCLLAGMLGVAAAAGAAASETTGDDRTLNVWTAADDAATGRPAARPKLDLSAAIDARKSYAIPPVEIVAFDVLLNRFNRYREGPGDYDVTASSIRRNARSRWVVPMSKEAWLRSKRPVRSW